MRFATPGRAMVFISLLGSVLLSLESEASPQHFDAEAYRWAEGRTIDTVYVHGNTRVKTFAIEREMESRAGQRLDARAVDRDQRYVGDLSPFATVAIHVEPIGDDHCALHVVVTERPTLLLKLVYPVLDYDINTERLVYGIKWHDRNFRRRLQDFSLDANRDNRGNDAASAAWSTQWFGWKHLGTGTRFSYFNRRESASAATILEQYRGQASVSLPLTQSRISFSQLIFGMALADNHIGVSHAQAKEENLLSPSLGFAFDNRDATIKPFHGAFFYVNVLANHAFNRGGTSYYRLDNDMRWFHALNPYAVLAAHRRRRCSSGTIRATSASAWAGRAPSAGGSRATSARRIAGCNRSNCDCCRGPSTFTGCRYWGPPTFNLAWWASWTPASVGPRPASSSTTPFTAVSERD